MEVRHAAAGTPREGEEHLRAMELAISWILRVGVLVSVAVIAAGLALTFARHPGYGTFTGGSSYHHLTSTRARFPHTFSELGSYLAAGRGRGVVVVGVLLLILTPVVRVAASAVLFLQERDRPMTLVTLFVLVALVAGFFLGGGAS